MGKRTNEEAAPAGTSELRTENLLLRRYRVDDDEQLYENFGTDPDMYKYSGWNPYATPEMTKETVKRFIESYDDKHSYSWVMDANGDGVIAGTIGAYDYADGQIEVGFSVAKGWQGRGLATEALQKVLEHLTVSEGISSVTAWCAAENISSRRVLEKSGMKLVQTEKDGLEVGDKLYDKLIFEYSNPAHSQASPDSAGKKHYVYILRCADGTFYTGYTTDPKRRAGVHNSGKGAKYTRARLPVELIYTEEFGDKREAQSREYAIKQLTRAEKEHLILMGNSEKLKKAIEFAGTAGVKVLEQKLDSEEYRAALLKVLDAIETVSAEDIKAAAYPANIQNTLLMDQQLVADTVTEELDQLSLLNTVVTYVACNSEGMPEHSKKYMDRVTDLRKALESVYDREAIRFCGTDGC